MPMHALGVLYTVLTVWKIRQGFAENEQGCGRGTALDSDERFDDAEETTVGQRFTSSWRAVAVFGAALAGVGGTALVADAQALNEVQTPDTPLVRATASCVEAWPANCSFTR